mgnify:CR=1 FL=1
MKFSFISNETNFDLVRGPTTKIKMRNGWIRVSNIVKSNSSNKTFVYKVKDLEKERSVYLLDGRFWTKARRSKLGQVRF